MERTELIQSLIDQRKYRTYLEIGVLGGYVFFKIRCRRKIAVDPKFIFNWKGWLGEVIRNRSNLLAKFFEITSDQFFASRAKSVLKEGSLDIVLIDGMHEFRYVLNDVENSLKYLSENGIIVLHDCNPASEEAACVFNDWKDRNFAGLWNGDVWKVILYLSQTREDLNVFVADCDQGLGIITKGNRKILNPRFRSFAEVDQLTYKDLERERIQFLNLKPVNEVVQMLDLR